MGGDDEGEGGGGSVLLAGTWTFFTLPPGVCSNGDLHSMFAAVSCNSISRV